MAIAQSSTMLVQSSHQSELAERVARRMPSDGTSEPLPGLHLYRHSRPGERVYHLFEPAFCVIAQGSKRMGLGEHLFVCDPAHYVITTIELPLWGEIIDASPARPYLSIKLALDSAVVTSVMLESGFESTNGADDTLALDVSPLDGSLLDATLRLIRLVERPDEQRVLAPLVIREIVYRLLTGAQGRRLSHLVTADSRAYRMARAIAAMREHFDQPLRIDALARQFGMSVSSFRAHFRAVTSMSPLQFQKQLRLQEARRLLMSRHVDASEVGYRVGYDSPSHFSRDYKRCFGEPPIRDVERLRHALCKAEP